jgi:hypothetical protein
MGPLSIQTTVCQDFSPVIRIGPSHPLTRKRMLLPPFGSGGGGGDTTGVDQNLRFCSLGEKELKIYPRIKWAYRYSSPIQSH